jgi:hypothetical protein
MHTPYLCLNGSQLFHRCNFSTFLIPHLPHVITHCHLGTTHNFLFVFRMVFLTVSKSGLSLCALIVTSLQCLVLFTGTLCLMKVFMTIIPQTVVFHLMTTCHLVGGYQHFIGTYNCRSLLNVSNDSYIMSQPCLIMALFIISIQ